MSVDILADYYLEPDQVDVQDDNNVLQQGRHEFVRVISTTPCGLGCPAHYYRWMIPQLSGLSVHRKRNCHGDGCKVRVLTNFSRSS